MIAALLAAAIVLPNVPGAYNHSVTQATVSSTVCAHTHPSYSSRVRPPKAYTSAYKRRLLGDRSSYDFQLDHLVSLGIGGYPENPRSGESAREYAARPHPNLWLEPRDQAGRDDILEGRWHRQLCAGQLTLREARRTEVAFKRRWG